MHVKKVWIHKFESLGNSSSKPLNTGEDIDGDGFVGKGDNCPKVYNANQLDTDNDGKKTERNFLFIYF